MYLFNLEALTAYTDIVSSDVLARFCSYFVTVFLPNKNIFVTHPLTGVLNNATGRILHRTVIGGIVSNVCTEIDSTCFHYVFTMTAGYF